MTTIGQPWAWLNSKTLCFGDVELHCNMTLSRSKTLYNWRFLLNSNKCFLLFTYCHIFKLDISMYYLWCNMYFICIAYLLNKYWLNSVDNDGYDNLLCRHGTASTTQNLYLAFLELQSDMTTIGKWLVWLKSKT